MSPLLMSFYQCVSNRRPMGSVLRPHRVFLTRFNVTVKRWVSGIVESSFVLLKKTVFDSPQYMISAWRDWNWSRCITLALLISAQYKSVRDQTYYHFRWTTHFSGTTIIVVECDNAWEVTPRPYMKQARNHSVLRSEWGYR